jgi:hypothetical protein
MPESGAFVRARAHRPPEILLFSNPPEGIPDESESP